MIQYTPIEGLADDHGFAAKVIEFSQAQHGGQLITLQLRYPRFIHSEFMTHRVFSRNASSSRAIPVNKLMEQVKYDPAMPIYWGKNQHGMQAAEELNPAQREEAIRIWRTAADAAVNYAAELERIGAHKQLVNRVLEPWQWMHVVVTSTEWSNFFGLRDHPAAQPEIQHLAKVMHRAISAATPVERSVEDFGAEAWHLPYITAEERAQHRDDPIVLARMSAARCARVSYLRHDRSMPSLAEDLALYTRLADSRPIHASPMEHQAHPLDESDTPCRNFSGWMQHRVLIEAAPLYRRSETKNRSTA